MSQSSYTINMSEIDMYRDYLLDNGFVEIEPTNQYELVRAKRDKVTLIVYTNSTNNHCKVVVNSEEKLDTLREYRSYCKKKSIENLLRFDQIKLVDNEDLAHFVYTLAMTPFDCLKFSDVVDWLSESGSLKVSSITDYLLNREKSSDETTHEESHTETELKFDEDLKNHGTTEMQLCDYILKKLKAAGFTIQYLEAKSGSMYIKLDYGVSKSLRIADHDGINHLRYTYQIGSFISETGEFEHNGTLRHNYRVEDVDKMLADIIRYRDEKVNRYGILTYVDFMNENIQDNSKRRGFWSNAKLIHNAHTNFDIRDIESNQEDSGSPEYSDLPGEVPF